MKIIMRLMLIFILTQTSTLLYCSNISNDSLKHKPNNFSYVFVDVGGSSPWFSLNYQQTLFSKGIYDLGVMTGVNNRVIFELENFISGYFFHGKIFQNHLYLLGTINTQKISFDLGMGIKFSYLYDGSYFTYYEIGSPVDYYKYISLYPKKLETDLLFNFSIRYHVSRRFFLRFGYQLKICDISKNYTSYFYLVNSGSISSIKRYNLNVIHLLSLSLIGFTSNPSKKNSYQNIYNEHKNSIFVNPINYSFGYERRILKKDAHALYASYQNIIIPYKRYYESNKRGIFYVPAFSINYCFSPNQAFTPVIGLSYGHVYNKFSVFDKLFYEKADYLRANIGLKFSVYKNLFLKINYEPKIKVFNDNTTFIIGISKIYPDLIRESITDLNFTFGYAF